MIAHIKDGSLVKIYAGNTGRVYLANGDTISPPIAGYTNGLDSIVEVVEEMVDNSTTSRTKRDVVDIVEADRVIRRTTIMDDPVTVDDVIAERDRRLEALASGYTERERETWHVQVYEAHQIKADPAAPAPLLSAISAARGISVGAMADVVLTKASAFAAATGAIMVAATIIAAMDPIPVDYADDARWV